MPHDPAAPPAVVEEVRPPSAPGAPGWDDFVALTDVVNRAQSHDLGHDAFVWLPQELIADYADVAHGCAEQFRLTRGFGIVHTELRFQSEDALVGEPLTAPSIALNLYTVKPLCYSWAWPNYDGI